VSVRRGETEYWISTLPLGGYVKMGGMEEQEGIAGDLEGGRPMDAIDPARAFDRKPVWARLVVLFAGVTMNVILAFVIYGGMAATVGTPEQATTIIDSVDAARLPMGAQALAQVHFGDKILRINGDTVRSWDVLARHILTTSRELRFDVAGRSAPVVVQADSSSATRIALLEALVPRLPPRIDIVQPGSPAQRGGLQASDLVVRANGDTMRSWSAMQRVIRQHAEDSLRLDVLRGESLLHLVVVPRRQQDRDSTPGRPKVYGQIGAYPSPPLIYVRQPLGRAAVAGVRQTLLRGSVVLALIKGLVVGDVSVREVGGPILIAQMSGQVARLGLERFLDFMAFFSVNLAILNLLPIPLLDGGQVVFVLAEAVRKRPLSLNVRVRLQQIGFVLLVCLMIFAIGNDVVRTFFH
jgi:regulator of sigma E protease